MNVRDPLNLRDTSSALQYLRSSASTFQQRAVQQSRRLVSSIQDSSKKFDDLDDDRTSPFPPRQHIDDSHAIGMSYALPQSAPTQRHHAGGTTNGDSNLGEKVANYITGGDRKASLPMYKDKPFQYPTSSRNVPWYRRRRLLALLMVLAVALTWWSGIFGTGKKVAKKVADTAEKIVEEVPVKVEIPSKASEEKSGWFGSHKIDWSERADMVRDAFRISWAGYEKYAWGYDEFHPKSKVAGQMTPKGLGWVIVDSLDTMMLMNLTTELEHARSWLSNHTYDQNHDVNTFETTIRMLGGLLSAHYLSTSFNGKYAPVTDDLSEDLYVEKAVDLADRLLGAYNSGSGIPFASVNLHTREGIPSHADGGASSTAEATSLQLEMKYLAKVTGEDLYWHKAEKVMEVIDRNNAQDGLVPIYIYADRGTYRDQNIRLGSRGDSYYEYLIKQYLQTSEQEPVYQAMWNESMKGVQKHLLTYSNPSNFLLIGEKPTGLMGTLKPKVDHLTCFMPGTIALAVTKGASLAEARKRRNWGAEQEEHFYIAEELMKTCWGMYRTTKTGLAPEIAHFNIYDPPKMYHAYNAKNRPQSPVDFEPSNGPDQEGPFVGQEDYDLHASDVHNLQRPETVESLFYMWRITGDEKYRNWGWEMFKSFIKWSAVEDGTGFSSIRDVNEIPPMSRDNMESFWLAETLKYFYLLFGPDDILPLTDIVFNTEAHPLPRFELGKLFKTGWTRAPRDAEDNVPPNPGSTLIGEQRREVTTTEVVTHTVESPDSTAAHPTPMVPALETLAAKVLSAAAEPLIQASEALEAIKPSR